MTRLLWLAVLWPTLLAGQSATAAAPRFRQQIRPERTDYRETSTYDDVMAFVRATDAASARVHLSSFGYSMEGRSLPLVVVGGVRDLVNGQHAGWLDSLVLLIAPSHCLPARPWFRCISRWRG